MPDIDRIKGFAIGSVVLLFLLLLSEQLRNLMWSPFLGAIGVACNSASTPAIIKGIVCWIG